MSNGKAKNKNGCHRKKCITVLVVQMRIQRVGLERNGSNVDCGLTQTVQSVVHNSSKYYICHHFDESTDRGTEK